MKSLLIIAAFVALAVASPVQRDNIIAGPAIMDLEPVAVGPAIIEGEPIAVGPAMIEGEPIAVGPAMIEGEPIAVGPAMIEGEPISVGPAFDLEPIQIGPAIIEDSEAVSPVQVVEQAVEVPAGTSIVQIILNINGGNHVIDVPISVPVDSIVDEPLDIIEAVPEPIQIVDSAPEPIQVVEVAPAPIGTPVLPVPVVPEGVAIGAPQLPNPVAILPELN